MDTSLEADMWLEEVTEVTIRRLVDEFYAEVRCDAALGPVFDRAIGDHWPQHLAKMYDFWSSVMLTSGRYKGNPMAVHMAVSGIEPAMFEQWLGIFEATADRLFVPAIAAQFRLKARRIAESLSLGLFYRPGDGLRIVNRAAS